MRRVVWTALVIVATVAGLILLWQFREAIVLFILSLAVAAVARPATDSLYKRGLSRGWAIVVVYLLGLLFFGVSLYLLGKELLVELGSASDRLVKIYEQITIVWTAGTPFQRFVASQLPVPLKLYEALAGEQGSQLIQNVFGVAQNIATIGGQLAVILVLSMYWTADRVHFERILVSLLPAEKRSQTRQMWRALESGVGGYLRSELAQSVLATFLLSLGYALLGLHYPTLFALVAALLRLIPWLGALLAVVLPVISAYGQSPGLAILAAAYTMAILLFLEVVVEPRLFNRRRYSSLLIVLVLIVMTDAFGLLGLIFAPPLAVTIQILASNLTRKPTPVAPQDTTAKILLIQARIADLQKDIGDREQEPMPEVAHLMQRLDKLAREAGEYFQVERVEVADGPPGNSKPA